MRSEIEISVVIATFNRKQLLARTLPTLFNQYLPPEAYEIIVVDDGSTDGTAQLLRSFNPRCKFHVLDQPNSGQAIACNKGFLAATGKLVLLLDDDIICPPNLLREHVEAHKGLCNIVVSGPVTVSPESPSNSVTDRMQQVHAAYERNQGLLQQRKWPVDTKLDANTSLLRQELLECDGFAPEFSGARFDVELGLRLHRKGFRFLYRPSAGASQIYSKSATTLIDNDARSYARNELLITRKYPEFRASSHLGQINEGKLFKRVARRTAVRSSIIPQIFCGIAGTLGIFRSLPAVKKINLRLLQAAYTSNLLRTAVRSAGSWKAFRQEFGLQLPVLLYHHVGPKRIGTFPHLTVLPSEFARQVEWLARNGYQGITPNDWLLWAREGKELPERPVLLTFDDGFKDLTEHAFPVLAKYGFGAAVFVVTSQIGKRIFWEPENGSTAHELLSADEIRSWADRGIEFGSHTVAHANLATSTADELAQDVASSKQELSTILGRDVVSFAYPYGSNNAAVRHAVGERHQIAFTTDVGLNHLGSDLLRLNRSMVQPGDSLLDLRSRVQLGWSPIQGVRRRIAQLRRQSTVAPDKIPARRVLHLLGTAQQEGTGIARIVSTLAKGIDPQKYTITVCFVGIPGPLVDDLQALGISTRVVPWKHPHRDPLGLLGLCRQLTKERFDIVHVHWGGRGVRWIASRVGKAKVLFHLHCRVNERYGGQPVLVPTENADAVIAVSSAVADASSHKNTNTIYTGVGLPAETYAPLSGMTIGTAGRLLPLKGILHLLRAISMLRSEFPDLRLEIAGDGPERSNLQNEIIALGLTDVVRFLGWLPEVNSVMASWQIFVQPSLEEGLPVAVLEAMAFGLPVIASDVGGIPEIIEDGVTGKLVPPGDPTALAASLRVMLLNVKHRQSLGRAARIRIRQHFSSETMVSKISAVYDELLK